MYIYFKSHRLYTFDFFLQDSSYSSYRLICITFCLHQLTLYPLIFKKFTLFLSFFVSLDVLFYYLKLLFYSLTDSVKINLMVVLFYLLLSNLVINFLIHCQKDLTTFQVRNLSSYTSLGCNLFIFI